MKLRKSQGKIAVTGITLVRGYKIILVPTRFISDSTLMESLQDRIADSVLTQFDALPAKCKPAKCDAGICSWVPLSGIVVSGHQRW